MSGINTGKVIVGGLLAGVVINVVEGVMNTVVLADRMRGIYAGMNVPEPAGTTIIMYLMMGFVIGILVAWLYAAIRPRFGAGPRTGVIAGLVVWFAASVLPITSWAIMGILPLDLLLVVYVYTGVTFVVAGLVAGKVYAEGGPAL